MNIFINENFIQAKQQYQGWKKIGLGYENLVLYFYAKMI